MDFLISYLEWNRLQQAMMRKRHWTETQLPRCTMIDVELWSSVREVTEQKMRNGQSWVGVKKQSQQGQLFDDEFENDIRRGHVSV